MQPEHQGAQLKGLVVYTRFLTPTLLASIARALTQPIGGSECRG